MRIELRFPVLMAGVLASAIAGCQTSSTRATSAAIGSPGNAGRSVAADSGERHLSSIRQITFGGENAEAYFSADGKWITFQSTRDGRTCDQQYTMRSDG